MTSPNVPRTSGNNREELNDAIAALIACTKRISRKLNLLEINEKLAIARKHLGSLAAVAAAVGLSAEMLRQFSRVAALSPHVKKLIREGKLKGVDLADRISRLPKEDQGFVADRVALGELDSGDVRAIVSHRKAVPGGPIRIIVQDVLASKNVREYVLQFRLTEGIKPRTVRTRLHSFFGSEAIRGLHIGSSVGELSISESGKIRLEREARANCLSKRSLLDAILSGEVEG